jgi:hypothetical protein
VTRWSIGQTGAAAVPQLSHLVVIHTTSPVTNAQTNALFKLLLVDATGKEVRLDFPTLPHNERERGRTDQYRFDLTGLGIPFHSESLGPKQIGFSILSGDAWLPSSVFVVGFPFSGSPMLLVGHTNWPDDGWFSTDPSDGGGEAERTRFLDEGLRIPF